ncbi:MAG: TIGR03885 family FMN-dependent LLM class oxidoreductase [Phycisphaerae bacterium]|nr:TIGR03885 family FMN-dependent LLM class oxidoreductase [Phycisphaerae bacterium]
MKIGYHASHEQFGPAQLLELARLAQVHGFEGILSSDHFQPWTHAQGHSGFSLSWLGAALALTDISCGVVCAPGQRYHPAVLAQAGATLAEMFPGRFWIAAGSGQMLNEGITGQAWPEKTQRNQRLKECVDVMRLLWSGETVSHRGMVTVESARLYETPEPPPIIGAALSPETAAWMGSWADGLITVSRPQDELRQVVEAFRDNGGRDKPMYLKTQVSYARKADDAVGGAFDQWHANIFSSAVQTRLASPEEFEAASKFVTPDDLFKHVRISSDVEEHVRWLRSDFEMGFQHVYVHNVNRGQREFIEDFGAGVLPELVGQHAET